MRILLVEDERRIADFIARGLSEQGHAVDVAGDGNEAVDWLGTGTFDLIILDSCCPAAMASMSAGRRGRRASARRS
jgi:DNA-binding response OmpR family regulator